MDQAETPHTPVANGVTADIAAPSTQAHGGDTAGNGQAAPSRDALELSKLSLELGQLAADALSPDEVRAKKQNEKEKSLLELEKLRRDDAYERKKNELELQRMRQEAVIAKERNEQELQKLQREAASDQEKSDLEMQKLRDETKNAHRSQYFELGKTAVTALSIIASVWVAANSIEYQRDKDRSVDVSKQLVHFQDQIATADIKKQRNAIAAVRSLRKDAIPSLMANLDVDHDADVRMAVHAAILELNEDVALQESILRELLSTLKYVALRPDLDHLGYYLSLWQDCLRQHKRDNPKFFQHAVALTKLLAADLVREIESKEDWGGATKDAIITAITRLRS